MKKTKEKKQLFFKKKSLDAKLLHEEHSQMVSKYSERLAKKIIKNIEIGIQQAHNEGYEFWCTSIWENRDIRKEILDQQQDVREITTKLIVNHFKDNNFEVELRGKNDWEELWIRW